MQRVLPIALALALAASAQEKKESGGDRIGKDKAPNVARKAFAEIQKKKGAAIGEAGETSAGPGPQGKQSGTFEGVMKRDFASVKGTLEIYAKRTSTLVNTGARFDTPDELEGPQQLQARLFRNPSLLLNEASKLVAGASFGGDESIDGKACREVAFPADEATVKQYLKDLGDRLSKQFRGLGGGFGGGMTFASIFDEKNSTGLYQIFVGKEDLLIYRLTFTLKPAIKPNALPPQVPKFNLDQRFDVKFSKWDEDLPLEFPAAVKAKWGLR